MDEPTLAEMLRDLQADVSRILSRLDQFVTQEQRASDKEILDLRLTAIISAHEKERARLDGMRNLVWTAVAGPVIVGVILYLLIGKAP